MGFPTASSKGSSPLRHKPVPVKFGHFHGDVPKAWIFQADRYFDFYGIIKEEKLNIASFYLDGKALEWYRRLYRNKQLSDWTIFTEKLRSRFRKWHVQSPVGRLSKLRQTSTVAEFQSRFEALLNETNSLPEWYLVEVFLSGLRFDILSSVTIHQPTTLDQAITLAHMHEQRILSEKGPIRPAFACAQPILPNPSSPTLPAAPSPALPTRLPFKRLTTEEIQKDEIALPENFVPDDLLAEELQCLEVQKHSSISYHALAGGVSSNTLCFTGHVNDSPVQVLFDGGSIDNFIQSRVAKFLQLPIEPIPRVSVMVGSGQRLSCDGVCRQVPLSIQGCNLTMDFYVLPLHGLDLVIGVSWLATLGPVVTDYGARVFEFTLNNHRFTWQGDLPTDIQPVQLHSIRRMMATDAISSFFHLELVAEPVMATDAPPPDLGDLLDTFVGVFQNPQGLPPTRPQDHVIHLLAGVEPLNVKPYRYPYFQKHVMEQLVSDMLRKGVIRPSTSPFSSPVLLVRKKDETWRFCVDYRALNAVTVRDRFLIPTIDELFDELYGAQFFSKLDLLSGYHQIRVRPEDLEKIAFRTHDGHYEFLVMSFGLSNAPSTFQATMNDVFRPFLRRFVLVFFDDILVYSPSWSEHLEHLRVVLQDHKLVAKRSKCVFGQQSVDYLGHVISHIGLAVDPAKITAIKQLPQPRSMKEVRGFLGLAGYYLRFIYHYASVAAPLTDLLRKDAFQWSPEQ
uniref:Uncharacterized protein LOC104214313 n=1 Tax=Nicotiana sylvestris TaxID=4096 RepID=A0A1U7VBA1_NICSY|nr:PREDICTED: uncharacterized protein LOC104214313 [Nicotiana sylvestris]